MKINFLYALDISDAREVVRTMSDILIILSEFNIKCKIDVYMHKYDPNIDKSDKYSEENINQNLTFRTNCSSFLY